MAEALILDQNRPRDDATVLVVQQNRVDRLVLKRAISALRKVTPHLVGAVLNAVDMKSSAYYGYKYKYREKDTKDKKRRKEGSGRRPVGGRAESSGGERRIDEVTF